MTIKEFNSLATAMLKDKLSAYGFKSHKKIFYLHRPPNILVLVKHFQKDYFQGFYIAVTHDFLSNTKDESNELSLRPYLEDYPFSISIDELENQYKKFKSVKEFDYDTNFMSRVILPTRTQSPNIYSMYDKVRNDENLAKMVINSAADRTIEYGLKLLNEYTPAVSYQSVTRHKKAKDFILERFQNEIEAYCKSHNIPLHKRKKGWFSFFR